MSAILARGHSATMRLTLTWLTALPFLAGHAAAAEVVATAPQWQEVELTFTATRDTANPYTDTEAWADFAHDDGTEDPPADVLGRRSHVPRAIRLDEVVRHLALDHVRPRWRSSA